MKWATFRLGDRIRGGRLFEDHVIPKRAPEPFDLASWLERLHALEELPDAEPVPLTDVNLLPPIPAPRKIICVGANFEPHRVEMGRPKPSHPMLFTRFASTLVGQDGALVRPRESAQLDYEGELAVVIGRTARRVDPADAWSVVAGVSVFNDATIRDWQRHTTQFTPGKNFDRTAGFGPCLVTTDALPDVASWRIETRVNGDLRQEGSLDELTFPIPRIIAYASAFTTLGPGDVIATGTPSGVGASFEPPHFLEPGDLVEVSISGVGQLRNTVTDERS